MATILQMTFSNSLPCIKFWLILTGPINNMPQLVQIMVCMPLWSTYLSLSLGELIYWGLVIFPRPITRWQFEKHFHGYSYISIQILSTLFLSSLIDNNPVLVQVIVWDHRWQAITSTNDDNRNWGIILVDKELTVNFSQYKELSHRLLIYSP